MDLEIKQQEMGAKGTAKAKMDGETIEQKIKNIVEDLKAECKSAQRSRDREWVDECQTRLSQMYYVCQELGIDYGKNILFH